MAQLATTASFGFKPLPTERLLGLYRRLGCERGQFYRNPEAPVDPAKAKATIEAAGMACDSMHGYFGSHLDPSSPDPAVRAKALGVYRDEARVAQTLGARLIVVHPSPLRPEPNLPLDPLDQGKRAAALDAFIAEAAGLAGEMRVTFLIENLPGNYVYGSDPSRVAEHVRKVDDPSRIAMCFDTGHAHMTGDIHESIQACRDVIANVHINDNDGKTDSHLLPGEGTIDWDAVGPALASLPDAVSLTLEVFPPTERLEAKVEDGYADRLAQWFSASTSHKR